MPRAPAVKKSPEQLQALEDAFAEHVGVLSKDLKSSLAESTLLTEKQIASWFASFKKTVVKWCVAASAGDSGGGDGERDGELGGCRSEVVPDRDALVPGAAVAVDDGGRLTREGIARFLAKREADAQQRETLALAKRKERDDKADERAAAKELKQQAKADEKELALEWPPAVWTDVHDTLRALLRLRKRHDASVTDEALAHLHALYRSREQPVPATVTRLRVADALQALVALDRAWAPAYSFPRLVQHASLSQDVATQCALPTDAVPFMNRQMHDLFDVKEWSVQRRLVLVDTSTPVAAVERFQGTVERFLDALRANRQPDLIDLWEWIHEKVVAVVASMKRGEIPGALPTFAHGGDGA